MHLVTADGEVQILSQEATPELMPLRSVNIGALGVVTEVTIQCVKQHNLNFHGVMRPFHAALDELERLNRENLARVRYYWFSGTDQLYVMTLNPTDKVEPPVSKLSAWYNDVFLRLYVDDVLLKASYAVPALLEPINRFQASVALKDVDRDGRSDHILLVPMTPIHMQTEYAVPVECAVEAMKMTRTLVERNRFGTNVPVELRFVAADDTMLSPPYGHPVCHVGAYTFGENYATPYFRAFGKAMKEAGRTSALGQMAGTDGGQVARQCIPCTTGLTRSRHELDPEGMFANQFIHEIFD